MKPRWAAIVIVIALIPCQAFAYLTKGDMNNDGQITLSDVITVLLMAVGVYTTVPPTEDPTGSIKVLSLLPSENFRTATNVNFSVSLKAQSTGAARANFGVTFSARDRAGGTVFSKAINGAVNPGESFQANVSYGEPLTIEQFDSITNWSIDSITVY